MADSTIVDMELRATEDEIARKWRELLEGDRKFTINIVGREEKTSKTEHEDAPPSPGGYSTQDRNLEREFQRLSVQKYRYEIPLLRSQRGQTFTQLSGAAQGIGGGLMSFAFGGGLGGLTSGIAQGLERSMRKGGGLSNLFLGAMAGGAGISAYNAGRRHGMVAERADIAGVGAAEAESMGAAEGAAAGAAGGGFLKWLGKLPLPVKIVGGIASAAGFATDKMIKDVYSRGRQVAGFGGELGEFTGFDVAARRFVDPAKVASAMAQAKYDITSPAFIGLSLLGINPKGRDPSALAEDAMIAAQKQLKGFGRQDEGTMLTMAHATGLGSLFSDDELIRMYGAKTGDLKGMKDWAQGHKDALNLTKDQIETYQNLDTYLNTYADETKTLAEKAIPDAITAFEKVKGFFTTPHLGPDGKPEYLDDLTAKSQKDFTDALKDFTDWWRSHFPIIGDAASAPLLGAGGGPGRRPSSLGAGPMPKSFGKYNFPIVPGTGALTNLITNVAKEYGIDPNIMEGIRAGESLHTGRYDVKDDTTESSWGPFQLNRRRGLGVEFERDTAAERAKLGLGDLRDPRTIPLQADWVARYIKSGRSLGAWMGYHGARAADPRWGESGYELPAELKKTIPDAPPRKGGFHYHDPNNPIFDYPAPGEKVYGKPLSMNDMRQFQRGDLGFRVHVNNPAGANVVVSSGMLGSSLGNYGNS
jgi:hypothetical protein